VIESDQLSYHHAALTNPFFRGVWRARPHPEEVETAIDAALADWRDVFTAAFEMPAAGGQAWIEVTLEAGREKALWQLYVGYLAGKPVATSMSLNEKWPSSFPLLT
jgi:hypothetical protein